MRSTFWLALLALAPMAAIASDDNCKFRADRTGGTDAKGVEKVIIRAGAGDLKVTGRSNAARIEAHGVACAGKQEMLDASQISVRREGNVVYVETTLPQNDDSWSWGKNDYASIDLNVALPSGVPVDAIDSSGDATLEDLHSLVMQDSSGDLTLARIAGAIEVTDSSGDLRIRNAGSVRLRDSSGDIEIDAVTADVVVQMDSSGDMEINHVDGSVVIEQDSSGSIRVENVKGNVDVKSDSSGDIYAARVTGNFTVSEDSSGSIDHDGIGGRVTIPDNKQD